MIKEHDLKHGFQKTNLTGTVDLKPVTELAYKINLDCCTDETYETAPAS